VRFFLRFDELRGRFVISQARYGVKDQSYALWGLSQEALSKTRFPIGELTKPEVREIALKFGLRTAAKQESYEICFVADDNYDRFLVEQVPGLEKQVAGGEIILDGKAVGKHRGFPFYTVGQRRGIGAYGEPAYVTRIESDTNRIYIGRGAELMHRGLAASGVNLVAIWELNQPLRVSAKVRYKDSPTPSTLSSAENGRILLVFDEPKRAITPGQSVVFYDGEDLVGGGVIESVVD